MQRFGRDICSDGVYFMLIPENFSQQSFRVGSAKILHSIAAIQSSDVASGQRLRLSGSPGAGSSANFLDGGARLLRKVTTIHESVP